MLQLRRIMIIGGAGSGKSTLARRLGEIYDLPVHHLDAVFWQPGWVEPDRAEFSGRVLDLIHTDRWVIEGNYSATWPERSSRADLVIFLDISAPRRLYRALKRYWTYRDREREDIAPGCPEKFDLAFTKWILTYSRHGRPKALAQIYDDAVRDKSVHLRHRDVAGFLDRCARGLAHITP